MVTAADIRFWTSLEVTEEDATRFSSSVFPEFVADGGSVLTGEQKNEALCYLIAAKLSNRNGSSGKISESLGGYSYSRKSPSSSSYWMDLYHEMMSRLHASALSDERLDIRKDLEIVKMNWRYREHGIK